MKIIYRAVFISVLIAAGIALADSANFRHPSGFVTNPTTGAVICDTGAMTGPTQRQWAAFCCSSVNALFRIEHRNAANNADASNPQALPVIAFGCNSTPLSDWGASDMADQERIRIALNTGVTGTVSCTLYHTVP